MCARTKVVVIDKDEKALRKVKSILANFSDIEVVGLEQDERLCYDSSQSYEKRDMLAIATVTSEMRIVRLSEIGYFRYCTQRKIWEVALSDKTVLSLHKGTSANVILNYSSKFVQTHQSYIVNLDNVMLVGQNNVVLYPPFNEDSVLLGRTFKKRLQEMFIMM